MKIIDVAEFYTDQGGGVKTYINQKLQFGAQMGHEIVIVAPGKDWGEEERYGGRVIWVKGPRLPVDWRYYILWRESAVHKILDREQPDVVEGSSPWTGGWFAARWKGEALKSFIFHQDPVAAYPHTFLGSAMGFERVDSFFGFYWKYLQKLSKKFDTTVVSGEWLADRIDNHGVHNPIPVPFGIDKDFFSPKRRDEELRAKLLSEHFGLPEDAHLMIAISRHHPEKRLGTVIDGFADAAAEKPMGLLIFGDGPIRKYVHFKAGKSKYVKIMGFTDNRDQLADILASSDYFVHGSAAETYGIVVAEAVCSGLPVVVPERGGAADISKPTFGETYTPGDASSFKKSLLRIIQQDRKQLVEATKKAAENDIVTMEQHFEMLFDTYQELLDQKGR
ncbi:glycosyltransferase [Gracilimonas mengyeensis]|uniref:Alpha-1,6-mannosyltransferase n=1 Tax=Gracilimonas mengyeensis TaxID=1302730 RepID=A0A521F5B1_9BACT|nr:glycosyltransferase [Gracilimonas mengyeensis]SMO91333.1 alpha-1,6-mannosyltransferase [Gracilimonas mengyeensis]